MESLPASLSANDRKLLLACLVLEQFDSQMLAALVDGVTPEPLSLSALELLPYVEKAGSSLTAPYQVAPAPALQLLTSLRNEFAELHRTYCQRALTYCVEHLPPLADPTRPEVEETLMRHLDVLFFILADGNELATLNDLLTLVEQLPLQQHKDQAALRYYRAVWLRQQGQYDQAEQIMSELLADEQVTSVLRARLLNALGILHDYRGRYDAAIKAYGQSADLYQHLNDPIGEGKARKNQGIVYHELAQYEKAQPLFERCHLLAQQVEDRLLEARALVELGYTAKELGQWEGALQAYEQALLQAQALSDRQLVGRIHNNIGSVHCLMGHWSTAETHYQTALDLIQEQRDVADILHNLGFLYFVQDRYADAHEKFSAGLAVAQMILDRDAMSEFYYRFGCLAERQGELTTAYNAYATALATIEELRSQGIQEETRISVLGSRQHIYQAMVLICLQLGRMAEALTYVEFAKSRAFLDRWGQATAQDEDHGERIFSTAEIQTQLAPDTALVEFFATGHIGPGEIMLDRLPVETQHLRGYLAPPERLLAFVITNITLDVVTLGISLKQIEAQYFYRGDNRLRGAKPVPGEQLQPLRRWQQLAAQLLDPIRSYIIDKRHLYLVPHSTLHYLPLHALAPITLPLATAYTTLSYAPSATVLLKVCKSNGRRKPSGLLPCLAIGVDVAGLSHAEAEAAWVAHRLGGTTLVGGEATKEKVLARLGEANVVHFACHGLFRRLQPMRSALVLHDGELTGVDILQQTKMQAELVTLSACDTGLNHLAHGDELMGLTRSFLMQGAQTLIVSLWQVHDIATRLFMEQFYESWVGGATRAGGLLEAQHYLRTLDLTRLRQRLMEDNLSEAQIDAQLNLFQTMLPGDYPFNHPYYWGAFLLIGDPS